MEWLGHSDSQMVRHYFTLHDEQARRQMSSLDVLGEAGQQRAGVERAAHHSQEVTSQESNPENRS